MEIGMKNRMLLCLSALAMVAVVACEDTTDPTPVNNTVTFTATLTTAAEVPTPTVGATPGSGTFTAVLDTVTNVLTYDLTFTGLTSNVNNGHIHGPADPGATAGAVLNFNTLSGATFSFGATSGTGHGTALLTSATQFTTNPAPGINGDSLRKLLFAGKAYANIHTVNNTGGEIRGQITKVP
jgi:hypothetical protein